MGGLLLQGRRAELTEYLELSSSLISSFNSVGIRAELPRHLSSKIDFGDIDLVVEDSALSNEEIKKIFNYEKISRNSNVISFLFRGIQIDLNFFKKEEFESARNYLDFGDLSMFLGRVSHSCGQSYGHDGLGMFVRFCDEDILGKIIISRDFEKICSFYDFDYEKWKTGFESRQDVFNWISASKYFNKEKFKLESLNSINRIRNVKRPMFMEFVEWCETREFEHNYVCKNKTEHLFRAMLHFGNDWFDAAKPPIDARRCKMEIKSIFSGADLISFGLAGRELGQTLAKFKETFDNFDEECILSSKEEMTEKFKNWFEKSKNNICQIRN